MLDPSTVARGLPFGSELRRGQRNLDGGGGSEHTSVSRPCCNRRGGRPSRRCGGRRAGRFSGVVRAGLPGLGVAAVADERWRLVRPIGRQRSARRWHRSRSAAGCGARRRGVGCARRHRAISVGHALQHGGVHRDHGRDRRAAPQAGADRRRALGLGQRQRPSPDRRGCRRRQGRFADLLGELHATRPDGDVRAWGRRAVGADVGQQ